ncbi:MAG: hypothetical protein K5927_02050 [Lachnospiraceae bacterium]|nr:hypothetical protein [Lachnospiraceae bacterium]
MPRKTKRFAAMIMAGALTISGIPAVSFADDTPAVITGTYEFSSAPYTDNFTFREDCFMQSSYIGCSHLATLSSQVSLASGSNYGSDPNVMDISKNADNILKMLTDMGFENVSCNAEYVSNEYINTTGVAVGSRTIKAGGKTYTLLAIIPRSAGYRQEWAGNFNVGDNGFHEGFKSARDEVLRYVKSYIKTNNISGNIKVWTAGHSRGGAIANMVGGFFAGGGIGYFGSDVSITPEDVYCYTFATPNTVKPGASNSVLLSVEGERGAKYPYDTPMDAAISNEAGTLDPSAEQFKGIRSYTADYDLISLLPPATWNFTTYGLNIPVDNGGKVTFTEMEAELEPLSDHIFKYYMNAGNVTTYVPLTFDFENLRVKASEDAKVPATYTEFISDRLKGLTAHVKNTDDYTTGNYQDALMAIGGIFGILREIGINIDATPNSQAYISAACALLSYITSAMHAQGIDADQSDMIAQLLEKVITIVTKKPIEHSEATVDSLVETLLTYVYENCTVATDVADEIEHNYLVPNNTLAALALEGLKAGFTKLSPLKSSGKDLDYAIYSLLTPLVSGSGDDSGASARQSIYLLATYALTGKYPDIAAAFAPTDGSRLYGSKSDTEVVTALLPILLTLKDADGNVIKTYASVDELAAETLPVALIELLTPAGDCTDQSKAYYYQCLAEYTQFLATYSGQAAQLILDTFMYDEDEPFDLQRAIDVIVTFIGNADKIAASHYDEVYLSWMKAYEKKYDEGTHDVDAGDIASDTGNMGANVFVILLLASTIGLVTVKAAKRKEN